MNKNKINVAILLIIFIFGIFFYKTNTAEASFFGCRIQEWFANYFTGNTYNMGKIIGFIGKNGYIQQDKIGCGAGLSPLTDNFKNNNESSIFEINGGSGKFIKSRLISFDLPYKTKIIKSDNFIENRFFNENLIISEEEKEFNNPSDIIDGYSIQKTSSSENCNWYGACKTTVTYEITSYVITAYGNIYRGYSVQSQTNRSSWWGSTFPLFGTGKWESFSDSGMNWELVYEPDYLPKVDLKINNVDYDIMMTIPDTIVNLSWISSNADSCVVSGDWEGEKQLNGNESLGKLQRGTKNPGEGKIYNYSMSCHNDYGEVSDSVSVKIMQYPVCSFYSEPSEIVLPEKSNLYWNCSYANNCKIDQEIGSINATSGLLQVRPQQNTIYNLNCSGMDGDESLYTNVNLREPSINNKIWHIQEVIPR